jgi:hypothetical protein
VNASKNFFLLATALVATPAVPAFAYADVAIQLRGSRASVQRQHEIATDLDLTFLRTPAQVREFVKKERLEPVQGNRHYEMAKVSFPYARAAVKTFIERLAEQYFAYSGEKLVVTSLTRPQSRQPRNASPLSVHPTGIAVDFRIPKSGRNRSWLEKTLLSLERSGVLDATREKRPPHYHVAVFPERYEDYVASLASVTAQGESVEEEESPVPQVSTATLAPGPGARPHDELLVLPFGVALLSLGAVGSVGIRQARKRRD